MSDSDTARTARLAATYVNAAPGCFEKRGLRRHAGVWSLWALGGSSVISGHLSGWNLGLAAGGWSPMGRFGGWLTIAICLNALVCQVQDPIFLQGSFWVVVWLGLGIGCYVLVARHRLILTPDADAARKAAELAADRATR